MNLKFRYLPDSVINFLLVKFIKLEFLIKVNFLKLAPKDIRFFDNVTKN